MADKSVKKEGPTRRLDDGEANVKMFDRTKSHGIGRKERMTVNRIIE